MAVPAQITGVTLTQRDTGVWEVAWNNPNDSSITGYYIDQSPTSSMTVSTTSGFTTAGTSATIVQKPFVAPFGGGFYVRVSAYNASGVGATSSVVGVSASATPDALSGVTAAIIRAAGGTQYPTGPVVIEVRNNANTTTAGPTYTLGYTVPGGSFTTIDSFSPNGNIPLQTPNAVSLFQDIEKNLVVVWGGDTGGVGGAGPNTIQVRKYNFTGTSTQTVGWGGPSIVATHNLGGNSDVPFYQFAGIAVQGSTNTGSQETYFIMARKLGGTGAGNIAYLVLNTSLASMGSGYDPSWLPTPTTGGTNVLSLAIAPVTATVAFRGATRFAIVANGISVVDVTDGVVTSVRKAATGAKVTGLARAFPISADAFVVVNANTDGSLGVNVVTVSGGVTYTGTIPASELYTTGTSMGVMFRGFDAYYDWVAGLIYVLYTRPSGVVRRLIVAPTNVTGTMAGGDVNTVANGTGAGLRIGTQGRTDERSVAGQTPTTTAATPGLFQAENGNVAPNAPSPYDVTGFDATTAFSFVWNQTDPNAADSFSGYRVQIQRVSDGVTVVDTNVVSAVSGQGDQSYTLAANTLANAVNYQWRVATVDALGSGSNWSAWDAFTTSATGTLTITAPASNGGTTNVATYPVTWTYSQVNGYTQTQRRVRVLRTSDGAVQSDTGMQATTSQTYTASLPSTMPVTIEVSIITNAPSTPTIVQTRTITSSYSLPTTPTIILSTLEAAVSVAITNPAPTGSVPAAASNIVARRVTGSSDSSWVQLARVAPGATYEDHETASGTSYDYQVIAVSMTGSTATSAASSIVAPVLIGVYVYDPLDPPGTEHHFPYASGRTVTHDIPTASFTAAGRLNPLLEYGEQETRTVVATVLSPFGDDHKAGVQWWTAAYANRRALVYRDGRGRVYFCGISAKIALADGDTGTAMSIELTRIDWARSI